MTPGSANTTPLLVWNYKATFIEANQYFFWFQHKCWKSQWKLGYSEIFSRTHYVPGVNRNAKEYTEGQGWTKLYSMWWHTKVYFPLSQKSPAYGRHWISVFIEAPDLDLCGRLDPIWLSKSILFCYLNCFLPLYWNHVYVH